MDAASLAALCLLHAQSLGAYPLPQGVTCPAEPSRAALGPVSLALLVDTPEAREAIGRVAYAEAGNQGDSGIAGVIYTILNRLADGRWGGTVDAVLDAPHQFEPVMRAGGHWRDLKPVTQAQQAHVDTILNLALDGRLPDLTGGARYFQNPKIVAARAMAGSVPERLVNFGGAVPTATIGAHAFYAGADSGQTLAPPNQPAPDQLLARAGGVIFVGENRAVTPGSSHATAPTTVSAEEGGMFVESDGTTSNDSRP